MARLGGDQNKAAEPTIHHLPGEVKYKPHRPYKTNETLFCYSSSHHFYDAKISITGSTLLRFVQRPDRVGAESAADDSVKSPRTYKTEGFTVMLLSHLSESNTQIHPFSVAGETKNDIAATPFRIGYLFVLHSQLQGLHNEGAEKFFGHFHDRRIARN